MKRIALILMAFCAIVFSCTKKKSSYVPVSYAVENEQDTTPQDIYLPVTGYKYVAITVKFLTGSPTDSVTLEIQGLPPGITVNPQKASGIPTYYYKYTYSTHNMPVGTYPASIVATAPGTQPKRYNFNLIVIPNDCASLFMGDLNGHNDCGGAIGYPYAATGNATGTQNKISINNLGGYGPTTNTEVVLNCERDSLFIASQLIGNGVTIQGKGIFTANKMTIYYSASTAGGPTQNCTAILSK